MYVLLCLGLSVSEGKGKCYDEVATIMGAKYGVTKRFKDLNPKMLVVHCFGDLRGLSVSDSVNKVKSMKNIFNTRIEICNLAKKSPQRDTKLDELHQVSKNQYKG